MAKRDVVSGAEALAILDAMRKKGGKIMQGGALWKPTVAGDFKDDCTYVKSETIEKTFGSGKKAQTKQTLLLHFLDSDERAFTIFAGASLEGYFAPNEDGTGGLAEGTKLGLVYLGEKDTGKGNPMKEFAVAIYEAK